MRIVRVSTGHRVRGSTNYADLGLGGCIDSTYPPEYVSREAVFPQQQCWCVGASCWAVRHRVAPLLLDRISFDCFISLFILT